MDAVALTIANQAVEITALKAQIAQLQQENAVLREQIPEPAEDKSASSA